MRVLVVQHDHCSPPGPVAERFHDRGYDVVLHTVVEEAAFHAPNVATGFPDFTDFDAVLAMGAPWSAYDHRLIGRWVLPEIDQFRAADAWPLLGFPGGIEAYDALMVAGRPSLEPRLAPVPVRLPLPPADLQGSIYENQKGLKRKFFDAAAAQ